METPTPFDLNAAISRWQQNLGASPAFKADNLEELTSHLRASVQRLRADGLSEEEAFKIATRRIGEPASLEREFAKVNPSATWSLSALLFWFAAGLYLFQVIFLLAYEILCRRRPRMTREDFQRLFAEGVPYDKIFSHSYFDLIGWSGLFMLSIAAALAFILGARLTKGSWMGVGAFIGSFARPIRTALGLVLLGLVPLFLPFLSVSGYNRTIAVAMAAINVALVLSMVLLASRALRKISYRG
jgi:hypothetical protein